MIKYQSVSFPGNEIVRLDETFGLVRNLRDTDVRPVVDLLYWLNHNTEIQRCPQLYVGGGFLESWRKGLKDYGDIDLLAVFPEEAERLKIVSRLQQGERRVISPSGLEVPVIDFNKSHFFVKHKGSDINYLNAKVDESYLLEPFRESPFFAVMPAGSQIDLNLSSYENFLRNFKKIE